MKIVAISMVRNEADVVEAFVRHTAALADAQIDGPLLAALLAAVFAFTVAYAALLGRRRHLARLEDELMALPGASEQVAGAAIAEPGAMS